MSKGTPRRAIRIDDELWSEFLTETKAAGLNAAHVIRQLTRDWLNNNKETT